MVTGVVAGVVGVVAGVIAVGGMAGVVGVVAGVADGCEGVALGCAGVTAPPPAAPTAGVCAGSVDVLGAVGDAVALEPGASALPQPASAHNSITFALLCMILLQVECKDRPRSAPGQCVGEHSPRRCEISCRRVPSLPRRAQMFGMPESALPIFSVRFGPPPAAAGQSAPRSSPPTAAGKFRRLASDGVCWRPWRLAHLSTPLPARLRHPSSTSGAA